jgi:hypothetical protein
MAPLRNSRRSWRSVVINRTPFRMRKGDELAWNRDGSATVTFDG